MQVNKTVLFRTVFFSLFFLSFFSFAEDQADPNRILAFKRIYIEPVQDNIDGVFKAPVEQSYKEVFQKNPRFEIVPDKTLSDTVFKTSVEKKASSLDVELTVSISNSNEVFSIDKTSLSAGASGKETGLAVKDLIKTALKRIPFYGTVTGRDKEQLTFDVGLKHGLQKGDLIQISRVDHIKKHPLLKSIVDVQMVPVGVAVIDEAEDTMSFGHKHSEISGEKIERLYKVTAIEGRAPEQFGVHSPSIGTTRKKLSEADLLGKQASDNVMEVYGDKKELVQEQPESDKLSVEAKKGETRPELGFVKLGLQIASFAHSSHKPLAAKKFAGNSFNPGFDVTGELWITKTWFADLTVAGSVMSLTQADANNPTAVSSVGINASTRLVGLNFGFKYLTRNDFYGPQVYVKAGYRYFNWSTPLAETDLLASKTYTGINLGVGGSLPLNTEQTWGLLVGANLMVIPGVTEPAEVMGPKGKGSNVGFFIGGYTHISQAIGVRLTGHFDSYSADFGEGSVQANASQRVLSVVPALLYYF